MISVIKRKSYSQVQILDGADRVVASMPIPPGGVLLGYRAKVHAIGVVHTTVNFASMINGKAVVIGMGSGQMDTALSVDTLWDTRVPKDIDLSVTAGADEIKWDDAVVDTPFEEPGHINWNDMVQLGDRPLGLSEWSELVTFASSGAKFPHVDTTDEYFPTMVKRMGSNKKVRAKQASYFLLALGAPSWDEVTASVVNTIVDANWSALTYPDVAFDMMLPDILGLSETGAESPFAEMAGFVVDLVEPSIFEQTSGSFRSSDWTTFTEWEVRVATPGRPRMKSLDGGMALG